MISLDRAPASFLLFVSSHCRSGTMERKRARSLFSFNNSISSSADQRTGQKNSLLSDGNIDICPRSASKTLHSFHIFAPFCCARVFWALALSPRRALRHSCSASVSLSFAARMECEIGIRSNDARRPFKRADMTFHYY